MDLMQLIAGIPGIGPYLPYVAIAVALASALATSLPAPDATASGAYKVLYEAANWIALNKGHATNATAPAVAATRGTTQ